MHALNLPILTADIDRVPFHADPVLAAIERHSEAWAVLQAAPAGRAGEVAEIEADDALHALLATACATRAGMLCLIRHLRWLTAEGAPCAESSRSDGGPNTWAIAQAREADLSRCLGVDRIERLPLALPSGRLISPVLDLRPIPVAPEAITAAPAVPALVHVGRAASRAGEVLASLIIIVGGCGLVGFASLL